MSELNVMCSLAMKAAMIELAPQFEREGGRRVVLQWAGGVDIARRLRAGDTSDLVMMAGAGIDDLAKEGLVAAGSRVDLAKSKVGVAVPAGAPRPDLSSAESVKRAVLAAKKVAYSSGPSGVYLAKVFEKWNVAAGKLHQTAPGVPAGEVAARREAEIAFQQVSELLPVKGIDYVGPLPEDLQLVTVFSAGTPVKAKDAAGAKALTAFLTSAAVGGVLRSCGLEPA
jgi:molybdate transport system substrate-binding protein